MHRSCNGYKMDIPNMTSQTRPCDKNFGLCRWVIQATSNLKPVAEVWAEGEGLAVLERFKTTDLKSMSLWKGIAVIDSK